MTFISRNRIFRIGSHTSQAERWISEGAALSAVVYRCTSLGTRASGPPVRRMVGTDWEVISAVMVREPLAGKVCVSAMGWNRVATVSALVLRRTAGTPSPSPWPPSSPTRGAEGGWWGLERKNAGNRSRNSCVLGARASGPHLDGWNRGALVAVPVLRRTPGGPHLPPSPLPLPRWGRGRGRALPPLPAGPFRSPTGRGRGRRCIPFPLAPLQLLHGGGRERTPEIAHAMVACWEGGPLARILMEQGGTGCSAGAGSARLAALTFPPAPFLSPAGRGRGNVAGAKAYWQSPTQWSQRHGTRLTRNPSF